jgi:glycosyltransferase involved in cell wall biosynthesis
VDKFICISPFLEQWLRKECDGETNQPIVWGDKLKLIRPGLDISKFPLKTSQTDGWQVGMVTGNMWEMKGPMLGLNIFAGLCRGGDPWKLHIRGQLSETQYHKEMYPHFIESRGLEDRVKIHGHYADMNEFYEQIDVLLVPSLKEAFSYATAEAMAKGIPCVINNYMGSTDIWPKQCIFNTFEEAVLMLRNYRFILDNPRGIIESFYTLDRMMGEYNDWLEIK